jgi:hypothetical protein
VTRHRQLHAVDVPSTYDELVELWRSHDELVARRELDGRERPQRTPRVVVIARCFLAAQIVTTLVALPPLLRAVGA